MLTGTAPAVSAEEIPLYVCNNIASLPDQSVGGWVCQGSNGAVSSGSFDGDSRLSETARQSRSQTEEVDDELLDLKSDHAIETTGGNTSTFTRVTFPTPFPAGSSVVVLPLTQTFIHDVTNTGFLIRLNEVYAGWPAATV